MATPLKTSSRRLLLSVLGGVTILAAIGCGSEDGVDEGAVVTVYVAKEQCADAKRNLERFEGRAGELRVQDVCLAPAKDGKRLDLAVLGENARRATEDSSTVAFIEGPGASNRYTEPILEEAEVALVSTGSGATSMGRVLDLLADWDSGESPRETVWDGR